LLKLWVEGILIVISDWVIEVADCGKLYGCFVGMVLCWFG
jgi:hypothetical protein